MAFAVGLSFVAGGIRPPQKSHSGPMDNATLRISEISRQTGCPKCGIHTDEAKYEGRADESQKASKAVRLTTTADHEPCLGLELTDR